jgi:hypothetical protein
MCEQYAGIVEQLEVLKPGSPDHQRLVQLSQLLGAALEESQSSRETRPNQDDAGLAAMPMSALHASKDLLERYETLTDRERGQLDVLLAASHGRVTLPPDPVAVPDLPAYRSQASAATVEPASTAHTVEDHAPAKTRPTVETCNYCNRSLDECAEIKATRLDVWQAIHALHPDEIARRDQEATTQMIKMVGKPLPEWCR